MAPQTPEEWLPILADRLDKRQSDIARLRSYVNGNAPLPEMGPNTRATWLAFQKKARTNLGGIACRSHANRIRLRGVRVGANDGTDASIAARLIARDNRLSIQIGDAVWDMLTARNGYLVVGTDQDGQPLITAEPPEMFYAEPDPVRPWKSRAAIKVFRDTVTMTDYALVWVSGARQWFSRRSYTDQDARVVRVAALGDWAPGVVEEYDGNPPVFILDRRDGMGLIEPHLDVLDRINHGKLLRLSTTAIQAFRQRAMRKDKDAPPLPDIDPKTGQPIDWEKVFEPAPGALWELPEGVDIWESNPTDIRMMLDGEKADARDFAACVGTPMSMLQPDSANQSATGAAATTQQQVDECKSDIERIRLAAAGVMVAALRIKGVDLGDDTVEVDFDLPEAVTLAEKVDAYSKTVASGMSIESAQKDILGWSQGQIDEDRANRTRAQALDAITALGSSTPQPAGV